MIGSLGDTSGRRTGLLTRASTRPTLYGT